MRSISCIFALASIGMTMLAFGSPAVVFAQPAPPIITIPTNGSYTNDKEPLIEGIASAPGAVVSIRINGNIIKQISPIGETGWSFNVPDPLPDGTYTLDAAEQISGISSAYSTPVTFVVKTTIPRIPQVSYPPVGGATYNVTNPIITGTGDAGSQVRIYFDPQLPPQGIAALTGYASVDASGKWTATPPAPQAAGSHTLIVDGFDPAGNVSGYSAVSSYFIQLPPPPTVTATLSPSNGYVTDIATLTVTINNPSNVEFTNLSQGNQLPNGLFVVGHPQTTCTPAPIVTISSLNLVGVNLGAQSSCYVSASLMPVNENTSYRIVDTFVSGKDAYGNDVESAEPASLTYNVATGPRPNTPAGAPYITANPSSLITTFGSTITLNASFGGDGPMEYCWWSWDMWGDRFGRKVIGQSPYVYMFSPQNSQYIAVFYHNSKGDAGTLRAYIEVTGGPPVKIHHHSSSIMPPTSSPPPSPDRDCFHSLRK